MPHLVSRAVAALFDGEPFGGEGSPSVDTAREFRVMGDRGHESGVFVDDGGVFHHAEWFPGREPSVTWWSNSMHAVEVSLALSARSIQLAMAPITWRHPMPVGVLPPGFELSRSGATMTVSWDGGGHWVEAIGVDFAGSSIAALARWLPYSVEEVVDSIEKPPGAARLVPFRQFQQISLDEALGT